MNADAVQADEKGEANNKIKYAKPQSAQTISPETSLNRGIGIEENESEYGTCQEGVAAKIQTVSRAGLLPADT